MNKIFKSMVSTHIRISFVLFVTLSIIQGCAFLHTSHQQTDASACLANLLERNKALKTCKGIAKTNSYGFDIQLNERIAFISEGPDRLRVEMLTPLGSIGSPFILICNETQVFISGRFFSEPFYFKPKGFLLKQLLPIKLLPHEMISCLHGQLPVEQGMHATFDRESSQKILVLTNGFFWKKKQKIAFYPESDRVKSIEAYDGFQSLMYRITFDDYQFFDQFSIPCTMTFSNADHQSIRLSIQSYWTNRTINNNPFQTDTFEKQSEKGVFSCFTSWIKLPFRQ
ncbi:MAG: DUF4292 domain-containing protein [Candidatus Magnetomorum sp.]|nr:DUF4292 domain-containing protein [Candidatus Magnetomorum sp.]